MGYSNSSLVNHKHLSPNHSGTRNHVIDTITIHCVVGQCSAETLGNIFADANREASSNYGVGYDGRIGLYVEEKNRSWCSSSSSNDNRAITIEVASDTYDPYRVNDKAYNALIKLVADICKRNGIKQLKWSTNKSERMNHKNGCNMTVHRDYANKSCPGDYLYGKMGDIAKKVNALLGSASTQTTKPAASTTTNSSFKPYLVRVTADALNIRKGAGTNYARTGCITNGGVYTIVAESKGTGSTKGWGKLKSGIGWISLDYVKKL